MSSFDWNGNGKKDAADDFIDYHIINDSSGNGNSRPKGHPGQKTNGTAWFVVLIIIIILEIVFHD
ncbi:MAG: hypothetical protein LKF52_04530 [Butyrivibrio sp.]|jgi:hypothetical protein|nr:hypothetical protein [Butyrivibrio sp.]